MNEIIKGEWKREKERGVKWRAKTGKKIKGNNEGEWMRERKIRRIRHQKNNIYKSHIHTNYLRQNQRAEHKHS